MSALTQDPGLAARQMKPAYGPAPVQKLAIDAFDVPSLSMADGGKAYLLDNGAPATKDNAAIELALEETCQIRPGLAITKLRRARRYRPAPVVG